MKASGKCPKCQSIKIAKHAKAVDLAGDLGSELDMQVATYADPKALFFNGRKSSSTVSAWVCLTCGLVEYYADHPESL